MIKQILGDTSILTLFFVWAWASLLNSAVFLVFDKWGLVRYYELNKKKWMPCPGFCLFFWAALIEMSSYLFSYPPNMMNLFFIISLALCSAVISRFVIATTV